MKETVAPEYKPSIDFYDMKGDFPSMKLGDPVTVVLTGKVMRMSMSETSADGPSGASDKKGKKGETYSCCVQYDNAKFLKGTASDKELDAMDMDEYARHRAG